MRFPIMVRLVVGMVIFAAAALALIWVMEGYEYALGTVGLVVLSVGLVVMLLEPELRGRSY
ncbi:hypothetical protein [Haloarchaeobius sp. DFWS5]|uniref:hypothetical protein n=1 Tax=Haloarchaeobius sp. DFWS5 TaxID=3446114 RepID=UPI003EB770FC